MLGVLSGHLVAEANQTALGLLVVRTDAATYGMGCLMIDEVVAVVLDAIRRQGVILELPSLTAICDRWQTDRDWT